MRPLAAPKEEGKSTKEVSRSHKIIVSNTGLITITGGKWTTYRKIAEDIIDKAIKVRHLPKKECKTEHIAIHGNKITNTLDRENHLYIYGSDIPKILELQKEFKVKIDEVSKEIKSHITYIKNISGIRDNAKQSDDLKKSLNNFIEFQEKLSLIIKNQEKADKYIGVSSNGRTSGFGPEYRGSSPCTPAL